ncbi:inner membrane protein [Sphingomonas sanguinis]|jgi:hypothetical protein|uniref:YgjV family protein n=1 Tax=Sphingomonas sanguinis TaxID=33051 RepID=A0A7Y7UTT7_9SPHN|nr:YgjV family protein [Sphingomonas sanguinis]MBZ6384067.1 YgjV family protein [Sphingomonas sanguinis]NVP33358.1 YgjV family protein [Sphingomonas sanguinis]GBQ50940.1 hypothetical protein AA18890_3390 [Komagataeibacter europaeus LMG 18890]
MASLVLALNSAVSIAPGALGTLTVLAWPHVRRIEIALAIQFAGALAFAMYFMQGGSTTAALCCLVSAAQLLIARTVHDRGSLLLLFAGSALLLLALTALSWNGLTSALALGGGLCGTLARMQASTLRMKKVFLAAAPLSLAHNAITGSGFGLLVDVISIVSNSVAICRRVIGPTYWEIGERGLLLGRGLLTSLPRSSRQTRGVPVLPALVADPGPASNM